MRLVIRALGGGRQPVNFRDHIDFGGGERNGFAKSVKGCVLHAAKTVKPDARVGHVADEETFGLASRGELGGERGEKVGLQIHYER